MPITGATLAAVIVHPEGAPFFAHAMGLSCPHCESSASPALNRADEVAPPDCVGVRAGDFSDRLSGGTQTLTRSGPSGPTLATAVLSALLLLSGCATLAPGADPIVVRTEQALAASTPIYDAGMTWCERNVPKLSPAALKLVNEIRVMFPPVYRSTDSALQLYKAGKGGDPLGQLAELERLTRELLTLVKLAGGPDLTPPVGGKQP